MEKFFEIYFFYEYYDSIKEVRYIKVFEYKILYYIWIEMDEVVILIICNDVEDLDRIVKEFWFLVC